LPNDRGAAFSSSCFAGWRQLPTSQGASLSAVDVDVNKIAHCHLRWRASSRTAAKRLSSSPSHYEFLPSSTPVSIKSRFEGARYPAASSSDSSATAAKGAGAAAQSSGAPRGSLIGWFIEIAGDWGSSGQKRFSSGGSLGRSCHGRTLIGLFEHSCPKWGARYRAARVWLRGCSYIRPNRRKVSSTELTAGINCPRPCTGCNEQAGRKCRR